MQTYAYIESDRKSLSAVVSIGISVLSAAYCSAMISYDTDVDPSFRSLQPHFFGYIPNGGASRAMVFGCMVGIAAFHTLTRVTGVALLATLHARYVGVYLGGEIAAYFVYKAVRRDFRYMLPLEGAVSWIVSVVYGLMSKQIVDFSACIRFRHPFALGKCSSLFSLAVMSHHLTHPLAFTGRLHALLRWFMLDMQSPRRTERSILRCLPLHSCSPWSRASFAPRRLPPHRPIPSLVSPRIGGSLLRFRLRFLPTPH